MNPAQQAAYTPLHTPLTHEPNGYDTPPVQVLDVAIAGGWDVGTEIFTPFKIFDNIRNTVHLAADGPHLETVQLIMDSITVATEAGELINKGWKPKLFANDADLESFRNALGKLIHWMNERHKQAMEKLYPGKFFWSYETLAEHV